MVIAYIRVSTAEQSYESQRYEIQRWSERTGTEIGRWVEEKISGTRQLDRRTLGKTLKKMRKGDFLVCTELSRLGRNMMMVMAILNTCSQKGIGLYSIKDNFQLSDNLNAKIIAFAFSLAAEIERTLISQRTREALAARRKAGVRLGRPPGSSAKKRQFDENYAEIIKKIKEGMTVAEAAAELKIHRNTLYRYLKSACIRSDYEKK